MKIFLVAIFIFLGSCTVISNKIGLYKVESDSFTTEVDEYSLWVELTYHGAENDSLEVVVLKWKEASINTCGHSFYQIPTAPVVSFISFVKHNSFEKLVIGYPEQDNKKWPQVMAQIQC